MKRILLITPMPPGIGGISVSSQRLFENLKRDGYDVDVYKLKFDNPAFNNKVCLALRFFLIPFYILFQKKYDIIHCHVSGVFRKLYIGVSKLLFKRAVLIFTIHGDITNLLHKKFGVFSLSRADKIICVQVGDSKKTPLKIQYKCADIPAFILPDVITENSIPDFVLNFVKKEEPPLVIFNGSIVLSQEYYDLYGFKDTINVYKQLQEEHFECRLLVLINHKVVSNAHRNFMQEIKQKVLNDPFVLFVENGGYELLPLFKYAYIYIRPTKTDGDSLSVREALAMNCNVIASDRAIRPEGSIVYNTHEEFFLKLKMVLCSRKLETNRSSTNFYNEIVKLYETL